jgi:hypothetical protein
MYSHASDLKIYRMIKMKDNLFYKKTNHCYRIIDHNKFNFL